MQIGSALSTGLLAFNLNKIPSDTKTTAGRVPEAPEAVEVPDSRDTQKKSTAETARDKINADYKKAQAEGTYIVDDVANGGRFLDVSKLNDEELAAVVNEKSFSETERTAAKAEFGTRLKATLAPFSDSPRDTAFAVRAIYPTLSPAVRSAMGWNESMLDMGERIIKDQGGALRSDESENFFNKLQRASRVRGGLKFDMNLIQRPGGSVNIVA